MPEFFLELFSEEIPARMQAQGAADVDRLVSLALASLAPADVQTWYGPRRIALKAMVSASVPGTTVTERGPRLSAPEAALAGFLRKHAATRDDLRAEGEFHVLHRDLPARTAASVIAEALPPLLWKFPWPKSMRWGESAFTWVRPLRRIVAILDGTVVPFTLAGEERLPPLPPGVGRGEGVHHNGAGQDAAHSLTSGNLTEGHRFHAPGAFAVKSAADWEAKLQDRDVIADADYRLGAIRNGLRARADERDLSVVEDNDLLREVAGLTECPIVHLGPIDTAYMDLPPEVMQVSMRVNQRYFALKNPDGTAAPWFGFAANIDAPDGGAAIIAGNARVLRARFSDARHFWDLDRQTRLEDRVDALRGVTFHAKLGTQYDRAKRLEAIARALAPYTGADPDTAARAGLLAKADLITGMVGEFPELQGVMGGYYARHDGEPAAVADAIEQQYLARGADLVPTGPVAIAVALADRIDTIAQFFAIGEKPTGSGDPYALRRAALGIISLIINNRVRLPLDQLAAIALQKTPSPLGEGWGEGPPPQTVEASPSQPHRAVTDPHPNPLPEGRGGQRDPALDDEIVAFLLERLRVQLRTSGERHDVLAAILGAKAVPDLVALLARTDAVTSIIGTADGRNLLAAYRRAANILRIEDKKDGPHAGEPDPSLTTVQAEADLVFALRRASDSVARRVQHENFEPAMESLATLRPNVDAFFDTVTVNAAEPALRLNRLRILATVKAVMDQVADFSKIVE